MMKNGDNNSQKKTNKNQQDNKDGNAKPENNIMHRGRYPSPRFSIIASIS